MTGILVFSSPYGDVAVEVDEAVARAAGGTPAYVAKGGPGIGEVLAQAPKSFDQAMAGLRACAANLQSLVASLAVAPSEVTVEIGLKMSGSVGFIIAKTGAETEMKVSLTWTAAPPDAATKTG